MLVSLKFVERFVSLPKTSENKTDIALLAKMLTRQGFEVEAISHIGAGFETVVVGRIESCKAHPNANKLNVCEVNVGKENLQQIVCGAPNARVGLYVAVALPGTRLPGDKEIKSASVRDVQSDGMLCAREELGLPTKPECDGKGIWELQVDSQGGKPEAELSNLLGKPLFEALDLNDVHFELNVTPNRPDMLCHSGVAREILTGLAHMGVKAELKSPNLASKAKVTLEVLVKDVLSHKTLKFEEQTVSVTNSLGAPAFFIGLDNLRVTTSPGWLRNLLEGLGQNSVNAVVDASNYVLLAYGQPSHAFDVQKLAKNNSTTELSLRFAKDKEKFLGLDGKERELVSTDAVVADANGPHALLGVLGGEHSKVDTGTTQILLEFANPDPVLVRRSSRRIGRITDASFAFEKGIDESSRFESALELIAFLAEVTGSTPRYVGALHSVLQERSEIAKEFIPNERLEAQCGPALKLQACVNLTAVLDYPSLRPISADAKKFAVELTNRFLIEFKNTHTLKVLGTELTSFENQLQILRNLGFTWEKKSSDAVTVLVPRWRRHDVVGYADLVEEIARVVGIDHIPSVPLEAQVKPAKDDPHIAFFETLSTKAAALGYVEVVSFHFMREDDLPRLGLKHDALGLPLRMLNPIIQDEPLLQTTLIPDLLRKVAHNLNYGTNRGQLFHLSRTFQNVTIEGVEFLSGKKLEKTTSQFEYAPSYAHSYVQKTASSRPAETPRIAGIVFGNKEEKSWFNTSAQSYDLHTLMAHVSELVRVSTSKFKIAEMDEHHPIAPALHPGRRAQILAQIEGKNVSIGWVASLHPRALREYGIDIPCLAFELNAATLYRCHKEASQLVRRAKEPRRFPALHRDFAFLLAESVSAGDLHSHVSSALSPLLEKEVPGVLQGIRVFDLYRGKGVQENMKSVAFQLVILPTQRTLNEQDISRLSQAVVETVKSNLKGELRG